MATIIKMDRKISRLRKTTALSHSGIPSCELNGFLTPAGLYYTLEVRLVCNKPVYSIICHDTFSCSSLYDGESFEDSFDLYCELMLALIGVNAAEQFFKTKLMVQEQIKELMSMEQQDMSLKTKPLFLGDSDAPVC